MAYLFPLSASFVICNIYTIIIIGDFPRKVNMEKTVTAILCRTGYAGWN